MTRIIRQYFYKNNSCTANTSGEPNCICWHDEGTGPRPNLAFDENNPDSVRTSWREIAVDVERTETQNDQGPVNHPPHYTSHPSGVECIQITEHFNFNVGNAIKYLWRAGLKGDAVEDLQKAKWYIEREIARVKA